jgi:hypothetical protein
VDDGAILDLTPGEKNLQDVLLQLAGKVNTYIDDEGTTDTKYVEHTSVCEHSH